MDNISKRQQSILSFINERKNVSNREILEFIKNKYGEITRYTIIRDLEKLVENKQIKKVGQGRSVVYEALPARTVFEYFDPDEYYKINYIKRELKHSNFNFQIFDNYSPIFGQEELSKLDALNKRYRDGLAEISSTIYKKEIERLTIDLSWKSSSIEGNTYTILETEQLLKYKKEASGHSREEAIMILNHKEAIDYSLNNKTIFRKLNISKIEDFHYLIINDLGVKRNLREKQVRITGTKYLPLDNQYQIKEALEKAVNLINSLPHPLEKAFLANLLIAYIQPFEDGNKRTSRLLANAILFAYDYCPLSFVNIETHEYKKAVLLFYEQNSALYFKELFVEQFKFAVDNYFRV